MTQQELDQLSKEYLGSTNPSLTPIGMEIYQAGFRKALERVREHMNTETAYDLRLSSNPQELAKEVVDNFLDPFLELIK